jgi:hypothetical protein
MNEETLLFIVTTFMELATLACAYLGVRLFRHNKWLRLALIVVPLMANAILYFIFDTTTFFYLGVVLLLCIPFVWPRKSA